jgi:hypothetical protein
VSRGPSPNRGQSLRDVDAVGPDAEDKREWQKKRGIDRSKQVKLVKLSHMRYQHPDLNKITTFLRGTFFRCSPQLSPLRAMFHHHHHLHHYLLQKD